ncbi:MAG: hypothetical protein ABL958_18580 [Bdellovibrionia bacterium]
MRLFLFAFAALFTTVVDAAIQPEVIYDCGERSNIGIISLSKERASQPDGLLVKFGNKQEKLSFVRYTPSFTVYYTTAESPSFYVSFRRSNSVVTGQMIQTAEIREKNGSRSWNCEYTFPEGRQEGLKDPYKMARAKRERERRQRNGPINR